MCLKNLLELELRKNSIEDSYIVKKYGMTTIIPRKMLDCAKDKQGLLELIERDMLQKKTRMIQENELSITQAFTPTSDGLSIPAARSHMDEATFNWKQEAATMPANFSEGVQAGIAASQEKFHTNLKQENTLLAGLHPKTIMPIHGIDGWKVERLTLECFRVSNQELLELISTAAKTLGISKNLLAAELMRFQHGLSPQVTDIDYCTGSDEIEIRFHHSTSKKMDAGLKSSETENKQSSPLHSMFQVERTNGQSFDPLLYLMNLSESPNGS